MNKDWKYIGFALTLYILAIPISGLVELPLVGDKLQVPELTFIALLILTFVKVVKHKSWQRWEVTKMDKALILYGLSLTISSFSHLTRASFLETLGFIYLLVLYVIINFYLIESKQNIRLFLVKNTQYSAIFASVIGVIGLVLLFFGKTTLLVKYFENYPIFGNIYRVKSLTTEPIMLMSVLGVFSLIYTTNLLSSTKIKVSFASIIFILLSSIVMVTTVTKSIVMVGASILVILMLRFKIFLRSKAMVWSFLLIIFLFFSHFSYVKKADFEQGKYCVALEKTPVAEIGDSYLLRTCYGVLKEANLIAFSRYPLLGLGGGNFTAYTGQLKKEHLFPTYFVEFDPLSTYFGALSELGLLGFLCLLFLYYSVYQTWKNMQAPPQCNEKDKQFWLLMGGVLLFMVAEGFVTDSMNFRHYWLVLACLAAQSRFYSSSKNFSKIKAALCLKKT